MAEGKSLIFRAEGYGVTNTARFAFPTASVMSAAFGRITARHTKRMESLGLSA